jgi:hypothetical protein
MRDPDILLKPSTTCARISSKVTAVFPYPASPSHVEAMTVS